MLGAELRIGSERRPATRAASAAGLLRRVLAAHPGLAGFGWRAAWHSAEVFTTSREALQTRVDEFARALDFLSTCPPRRAWRSSYVLKHFGERWHRDQHPGADAYVSNGALIAAALALGLDCRREPGTPSSLIRR